MPKEPPASDLSVIIPSYNHAAVLQENVPVLLKFLQDMKISTEVIIVDDGSTDHGRTRAVATALDCTYISHPTNLGKGAAVRLGMLQARGKARIYTDADIPYEPEAIERFLWHLTFRDFHMVVGDRSHSESSYLMDVPWIRRVGSRIYASIIGNLVPGGWSDTQCGLKAFRANAALDLFSVCRINRFGFDVELLHVAVLRKYNIKKLPVKLRNHGASSVRLGRDGIRMFWDLAAIYWRQRAGRYENRVATPQEQEAQHQEVMPNVGPGRGFSD
jgi:dolichyl-phosphate beta-glucosyltransferase